MARSTCCGVGSGTARSTSDCALSLRMPVGPSFPRTIVPPGTSRASEPTPAARSAALLARLICPSRRLIHTGVFGVTESIQSRRGSSPPHCSWSQFPSVIHAPAGSAAAYCLMRPMNSAGVLASRSCTDARPKPPATKWTCESMNPGTTIIPPASMTRVSGRASFFTSALVPTTAMRSPVTASASAHGRLESPVHTRALTTAIDGAAAEADAAEDRFVR